MTWDISTDTLDVDIEMTDTVVLHSNWGEIGGTLSDQTDLKNALDAKQDTIPANTYDPYGAATSAVSAHNSANDAHSAKFAAKQDTIDDLSAIRSGAAAGATAYQQPASGIPKSDLASAVKTSLGKADSAYQLPSGGIPAVDMASSVQASLVKADTALQDAPSDNKQYARKNGAWAEVQGGGGAEVDYFTVQNGKVCAVYLTEGE